MKTIKAFAWRTYELELKETDDGYFVVENFEGRVSASAETSSLTVAMTIFDQKFEEFRDLDLH